MLNELRHDILSYLFDGLNYGLSVAKAKNNALLRKKGLILEQKGTRMDKDGEDWNGMEMTILKVQPIFSRYTNGDVAPLSTKVAEYLTEEMTD